MLVRLESLLPLMSSTFFLVHVASAQDQSSVRGLEDEEDCEIAPRIGLAGSCVDVFTGPVSTFHQSISGAIEEDVFGLILGNSVLARQLVNDVREPDEIVDEDDRLPSKSKSSTTIQ